MSCPEAVSSPLPDVEQGDSTSPEEDRPRLARILPRLPRLSIWIGGAVLVLLLLLVDRAANPSLVKVMDYLDDHHVPLDFAGGLGDYYSTMYAALIIALVARGGRRAAGFLLLSVALAGGVGALVQEMGGRVRPKDGVHAGEFLGPLGAKHPGFPSGHATGAMATASALTCLYPAGRPAFVGLAIFTGLSRIQRQKHYLADIVLGWMIGFAIPRALYGRGALWDRIVATLRRRRASGQAPEAPQDRGVDAKM